MSKLLIKRTDQDIGSRTLEHGELGIANNRLYFGSSSNKPTALALKSDIPAVYNRSVTITGGDGLGGSISFTLNQNSDTNSSLYIQTGDGIQIINDKVCAALNDSTKLNQTAQARTDGNILPVALDSQGKLAVRVPVINNPSTSKKIAFTSSEWVSSDPDSDFDSDFGAYKLVYTAAQTGFVDINYAVDIMSIVNGAVIQNTHCTIVKENNNGTISIYSSIRFNGFLILTSGGSGTHAALQEVPNEMPQIQFVGFRPNQITSTGRDAYSGPVSGDLTVRILGQGLQVGDMIELGHLMRMTGTDDTQRNHLKQIYSYTITEQNIGQDIITLPFVVNKLQWVLKFAHGKNNTYHRYPLWLWIKRPIYGTKLNDEYEYPHLSNIFSNQVQLQPHYKGYVSGKIGGWLSFT